MTRTKSDRIDESTFGLFSLPWCGRYVYVGITFRLSFSFCPNPIFVAWTRSRSFAGLCLYLFILVIYLCILLHPPHLQCHLLTLLLLLMLLMHLRLLPTTRTIAYLHLMIVIYFCILRFGASLILWCLWYIFVAILLWQTVANERSNDCVTVSFCQIILYYCLSYRFSFAFKIYIDALSPPLWMRYSLHCNIFPFFFW